MIFAFKQRMAPFSDIMKKRCPLDDILLLVCKLRLVVMIINTGVNDIDGVQAGGSPVVLL